MPRGLFADKPDRAVTIVGVAVAATIVIVAAGFYFFGSSGPSTGATNSSVVSQTPAGVQLTDSQVPAFRVARVGARYFVAEKSAFGSIDFNENLSVQVFPPYQGKIIAAFGQIGDGVRKGQPLYTIYSTDLLTAESTLIATSATLESTKPALERARSLAETQAVAQSVLEQALAAQNTAEAAYSAAHDAARVFGKSDAEIHRLVATHRIDPVLVVTSPIAGQITARNAQPGLLVQPGTTPAPYTVADLSAKWMLAYVNESDSPLMHAGQAVKVAVMAYPGRTFAGKISVVGTMVDPSTHRVMTRSEISDPNHELRPGMLASFMIQTGTPAKSAAVPQDAVVREGDGTMTVWVTNDRRRFFPHAVRIGFQSDGYDQVLAGLKPGQWIATTGAIYLSNMLTGTPAD